MNLRIPVLLLICLVAVVLTGGCGNPYVNPEISKAITEKSQFAELQKQTKLMERQTKAIESIAKSMEKSQKK